MVPKIYRSEILSLAHETPMSGHLGVNKTYHKILNHVSNHCRSCHTCQVVGKSNQVIPKAGLQQIPAFDEPFSRIIIDCVGPLPNTKSGNENLLTIMRASTRFPEAIPLRNIKTKTTVRAYERDFMLSVSEDNQSGVIEAFKSTSRYLDDLLNIDNNFFDSMANRHNHNQSPIRGGGRERN